MSNHKTHLIFNNELHINNTTHHTTNYGELCIMKKSLSMIDNE